TNSQRLLDSRRFCRELTKSAAKNFYYGLRLLPEPKRSAMFTLYAYMRMVDDLADEKEGRSAARRAADLEAWRAQKHAALAGQFPDGADTTDANGRIWPAFMEMAERYQLP